MKFFYCDDDLTEYCAISGTEIFEMKSRRTKYVLMLIGVVHVLVTADKGISQLHEKLQARRRHPINPRPYHTDTTPTQPRPSRYAPPLSHRHHSHAATP